MTTATLPMPVLVEVPVNHNPAPIPEHLTDRLNKQKLDPEEVAQQSERLTARSEALRDAHIQAVKDRAARETQRGEENAARKRRTAAEELRKLEAKIEQAAAKSETKKREQQEKRDQDKEKRQRLAEQALEARQQGNMTQLKKGIEKATRACTAVANRDKKVAEVVKRTGAQVKHALEVAATMKERNSARAFGEDPLDSPHPSMSDAGLASPHPAAAAAQAAHAPAGGTPITPRLSIPNRTLEVPKFDNQTVTEQKEQKAGDIIGKSPRRAITPRRTLLGEISSAPLPGQPTHTFPCRLLSPL